MSDDDNARTRAFVEALRSPMFQDAARSIRASGGRPDLSALLELARSLSEASGDIATEALLGAELGGYEGTDLEIPLRRRVAGYASPFPVRAIGLLDPEEIFLANREKFAQVTLTIGQSIQELEGALLQIQEGGVLALRVPAGDVSGEAITTDKDTEVYIYILPREIERVVEGARELILDALVSGLVDTSIGPEDALPETTPAPAAEA